MGDEGLLWIWAVRPNAGTAEVDARIRDAILPAVAATDGLEALFAGRRGTDVEPERVLAGVWRDEAALEDARRPGGLVALEAALEGPSHEQVLPILFSVVAPARSSGEPLPAPAILRIFRGRTRPDEIAAYVEAARRGTVEDIAAGSGPLALYLAAASADDFVTVSAWEGWGPIERATGGNVTRPVATRHTAHLATGSAAHYEIIPSAAPGLGPGTAAIRRHATATP